MLRSVRLLVRDDGVGFPPGVNTEIAGLLARKHYGLAGMHERAAIIGALLQIDSKPGVGTGISITWGNRH
jgi:signal transduction histidine kinase